MIMIKTIKTIFGDKKIEMINSSRFGEIPKTLYKYRNWDDSYHKRLITHGEIYLSAPKELNDPFDCGIDIAYHTLVDNPDLELAFCRKTAKNILKNLSPEQIEVEVQKKVAEGRFRDEAFWEKQIIFERNAMNEKYGLFCITPIHDNILMWAHYSNSHKGFCVGFNSEKLFETVRGRGGNIIYSDYYPEISPLIEDVLELFMHQTNTKAKFWSYEIEYRIFKNVDDGRIKIIPNDVVSEIILGCNISERNKSEIIQIAGELYPQAIIYQTKPHKRIFELDRIPI